jgi:hypothetical protein
MNKYLILVVLAAGMVAACGSSAATTGPQAGVTTAATVAASQAAAAGTPGTPTGGAPSSPVACSLLTAAEATAALGRPVSAGVAPVPGENTCVFSGPVMDLTSVQIAVIDPAEFTPAQVSVPSSFTVTPAPGVGDAAYFKKLWLPNTGGESLIELSVQKGQVFFTVTIVDHSASDVRLMEAEKTLALAAAGRA